MGLTGVPVLVADEDSEQIRILVGAHAILQYLAIEM
jgi:glutathione S-transferase